VDMVIRDVVDATTTIQYADAATVVATSGAGAVGSGNFLDAAEILEARRTLRRANAKPVTDGKYIAIIHPDNAKDLFEDPDIVDAFQYAQNRGNDNPLASGVLGDWMGVRFVESTNVQVISSYGMSGADIYEVVVLGAEAYGVTELSTQSLQTIVHPRGSGGHTDPLEQYSTIGWKAALAAKILNQDFLVKIYCASSRSTAA
jgi:N4-gp56 family major capsid protein